MAINKFCCGAECGLTVAGAGSASTKHWNVPTGVPTIETTVVRTGARAFRFTTAAGASVCNSRDILPAATQTKIVRRFYIRFVGSLPSADCVVAEVRPTAGTSAVLIFEVEDNSLETGFGTTGEASSFVVVADQWYRVEMVVDVSTGTHTCDISVDGTALPQATRVQAASTILRSRVGVNCVLSTANGDIIVDDIYEEDGLAADSFSSIGAGSVIPLYPNADGTHSFNDDVDPSDFVRGADGSTTPIAIGATTVWTEIDEVLTDLSNMIGVSGAAIDEYVELQYGDLPASGFDVIHCVVHVSSHKNASVGTANRQSLRLVDGGSTAEIINNLDLSETSAVYHHAVFGDAPSGGAWTKAKVDAIITRYAGAFSGQTLSTAVIPQMFGSVFEVSVNEAGGGGGAGGLAHKVLIKPWTQAP